MNRPGFALVALLLLLAAPAGASQQGQVALQKFKVMDVCARQAQILFPDFDAASNAKRDAQINQCLRANNLPPRAPLSEPGPR